MKTSDPRIVAIIVASALFMQNLDNAVVATALPAMARDLGVAPVHLSVAITSYVVALCVFIPVSGWVADRYGARRVFMAAMAVFALASALVGLSQGLASLVGARILQGIGGAMMVPVGRLLLLRRVRKEEILTATTWLTMPGLLGPILGPPLGGFLTDAVSWRAVFWLNVPVGAIGLLLVWRLIPDEAERQDAGRLDARGLVLWGLCLALVIAALETVGRGLVPGWATAAAGALGLAAGWLAVRHSRRVERPAVNLALLQVPSFAVPSLSGTLFRLGAAAVPFLVPLTLQLAFGMSATDSGLVAFSTALGAIVMKPLVRPVLRRFGFRATLAVNVVLAAGTIALCAAFTPAWPLAAIFAALALGGLARSLHFTALNALAFADLSAKQLSAGTAFYGAMQQFSLALGVVAASLSLEASMALAGRETLAAADFRLAFLVAAGFVLASLPSILRLPAGTGARVSGHGREG